MMHMHDAHAWMCSACPDCMAGQGKAAAQPGDWFQPGEDEEMRLS